jgi:hypothetical protein
VEEMGEWNFISLDEKSNYGRKEVLLQLMLESPNELSPVNFSSRIIIKIIDPLLVLLLKKKLCAVHGVFPHLASSAGLFLGVRCRDCKRQSVFVREMKCDFITE